MAHNSLWPAFVVLNYTANGHEHIMRIPVQCDTDYTPGLPFGSVQIWDGDGLDVNLETSLDAYLDLVKIFYKTTDTFNTANFWVYPTPESDPLWISGQALGVSGTNSGANLANGQVVMTYRSYFGGIARHYFMEPVVIANQRLKPPFSVTDIDNLTDYVTSIAGGWIKARDNGRLVVPIAWTTKINDELRKKYVLDA